ncbi:MAG: hypothetical protein HS115_11645 [Spirochaetales bacterium]|nr:hypothetical protein [Spirochaetales bacterium]
MTEINLSSFLFATPSLLSGSARVLDLAGTFDQYNVSASREIADLRALRNDMKAVGSDLRHAAEFIESTRP